MARSVPSSQSSVTIIRGAVAGAVAYLLGYLLTYAWASSEAAEALRGINIISQLLSVRQIPAWKAVGWVFYDAHFARTKIPGIGGATSVSPIEIIGDGQFGALAILVPVLLVAAGAAAAGRRGGPPVSALTNGAAIVVSYLPLAVIGVVLTTHQLPGVDASIGTDMLTGVALAGIVYPAVFGAIGGGLAWLVWQQVSGDRGHSMGSSRL